MLDAFLYAERWTVHNVQADLLQAYVGRSSIHGKTAAALYIGSMIQTRFGVVSYLTPIE